MGRKKRGRWYYRVRLSDKDITVLLVLIRRGLETPNLPEEYKRHGEILRKKLREVERWSFDIWMRKHRSRSRTVIIPK